LKEAIEHSDAEGGTPFQYRARFDEDWWKLFFA
jgi:hypothetical protein